METAFVELLQKRRSIRKYKETAVEPEKIKQILTAALMSPSSKRTNPWEFVVVDNHEILAKMSACRTYGSQLLENAPVGIVVCADTTKTDMWQCDASIASILMQLEAEELGLGSCWVQVYKREKDENQTAEEYMRELLGIPKNFAVLNIVAIGYKDEERKPYDLEKLKYEKIHYGKF